MPLQYDRTIRSQTSTSNINTMHIDVFDWDYDFSNPKHFSCCCYAKDRWDELVQKDVERYKGYLKMIEDNPNNCRASTYGGWPRIYQKVVGFGMASAWPYWEPRPTVLLSSTFGIEFADWKSLTGVVVDEEKGGAK